MKVISHNRKATFEYTVEEKYLAGIVLTGDEIKSIRQGGINIKDSFGIIKNGEVFLLNAFIAPYSNSFKKLSSEDAKQRRKLLLNKKEIKKLIGEVSQKKMTLIPTKVLMNEKGFVKIELALAKHKKSIDRKQEIKEKDLARQSRRELKERE